MPYTPPGYYQQPQYYQPSYMDQLSQLKSMQPYTPQMMPQAQPSAGSSALLWVQGEAGAKSYLVAPNTTVLLMDSENPRFYIKFTDPNGLPSMRVYSYTEITNVQTAATAEQALPPDHVTHKELENLREEFKTEMQKITELISKRPENKKGAIETNE